MFVAAIGIVILFFVIFYFSPQLYRLIQISRWRGCSNVLALTYDDGPDEETTLQLLKLFVKFDARATFYLVGFRAERHPDIVRQIQEAKHEIGSHTFYHRHAFKSLPWVEYNEVIACDRYLKNIVGHPVAYRPPYGKITLPTMLRTILSGRRVDWWSTASNDTAPILGDTDTIAESIISNKKTVVLMHSHHTDIKRREFVLELTRKLIEKAIHNNIRLVTMSELAYHSNTKAE